MQAENCFYSRNSHIRITESQGWAHAGRAGIGWGMSVQSPVYAAIIMFWRADGHWRTMTTGAVVAASMLGSRMIALIY